MITLLIHFFIIMEVRGYNWQGAVVAVLGAAVQEIDAVPRGKVRGSRAVYNELSGHARRGNHGADNRTIVIAADFRGVTGNEELQVGRKGK